jgi:hypothetical protein
MDNHQDAQDKRKLNTVHDIKPEQSLVAHYIRSQEKETNIISNEGSIGHDGRPYGNSPISELIPGEKISRIAEGQCKDQ